MLLKSGQPRFIRSDVVCLAQPVKNAPTWNHEEVEVSVARLTGNPSTAAAAIYGQAVFSKVACVAVGDDALSGARHKGLRPKRGEGFRAKGSPPVRDQAGVEGALAGLVRRARGLRVDDEERALILAATREAMEAARPLISSFDGPGLVSIAVSLAKLDYHDAACFHDLITHTSNCLPTLGPQALSNLIWALATVQIQPPGAWLTRYYAEVEAKLPFFNMVDVGNTLWGLCRFDLMPDASIMNALVDAGLLRLQSSSSGQEAATLISCLARYRYKYSYNVGEAWLQSYLLTIQPHMKQYLADDLVAIIHSIVCLDYMPSAVWLKELYQIVKDRLLFDPALSCSSACRLLWSLARIPYRPPVTWQRQFLDASAPRLAGLKQRALTELIWSMAAWDCRPTYAWLDSYVQASSGRLSTFKASQIAVHLDSLARLSCKMPTAWLKTAMTTFIAQLEEVTPQDLITFVDSLVSVCDDTKWLASQLPVIHALADKAASNFDVCDAVMHAKLVIALARADCFPGTAWLTQQQASLARRVNDGASGMDTETARDLMEAYNTWDMKLASALAQELDPTV